MAKQLLKILKLQIPGTQATPAPPLGPTLSQAGVNIKEFCDKFNNATREYAGIKVSAVVKIYNDRSYSLEILGPITSELIKKYAKIKKGSSTPNLQKVGKLTKAQVKEIAEIKLKELNTNDIEQAMKIIEGTAKQMGINIVD